MARSTGPIIAAGGITAIDRVISGKNNSPEEFIRIAVATGIAAVILAAGERVSQPLAVGIAWIAVVTVILTSNIAADTINATGFGKST
jgi:hypothetical protein